MWSLVAEKGASQGGGGAGAGGRKGTLEEPAVDGQQDHQRPSGADAGQRPGVRAWWCVGSSMYGVGCKGAPSHPLPRPLSAFAFVALSKWSGLVVAETWLAGGRL